MARIKLGAFVTEIRGSVGGTTFQANRFGFSAKNYPLQPKPKGFKQSPAKTNMSLLSQSWVASDPSLRDAYNAYAAAYPQYPKSGSTVHLSGYEIFLRFGLAMKAVGQPVPTEVMLYPVPLLSYATNLVVSLGALLLTLSGTPYSDGNMAIVKVSQPIFGLTSPSNAKYRVLGNFAANIASVDVTTQYQAIWGLIPQPGQTVYVTVESWTANIPRVAAPQTYQPVIG